MKHPTLTLLAVASTLTHLASCKRGDAAAAGTAAQPGAAPTVQAAAAPTAPVAPRAAPPPAVDPRWPQWLPRVSAVTVRSATRDFLEGYTERSPLVVLVESRRACETAGYTLSQTDLRRTRWENRFIFTATRGEEFVRFELVGQPARPNFSTFTASSGEFARTLMRRRTR